MKKILYITSFTFLGYLLQQLLHALIEIGYISLLDRDFVRFGFGLSWDTWQVIHIVTAIVFIIAGISLGFWQGKHWWERLYDEYGNLRKDIHC